MQRPFDTDRRLPGRLLASTLAALCLAAFLLVSPASHAASEQPAAAETTTGQGEAPEPQAPEAQTPEAQTTETLEADRMEWAALPVVAGNTDVGFQAGALLALVRYEDGLEPYSWRAQLTHVISFMDGPHGVETKQHLHGLRWDLPGLMGDRLRLTLDTGYERTINAGYYGIGNASESPIPDDYSGEKGRRNQFIYQEVRFRLNSHIHLSSDGDLSLRTGFHVRYLMPRLYRGSRLEEDLLAGKADGAYPPGAGGDAYPIVGADDHGLVWLAAGLAWDTRDDETSPTTGVVVDASARWAHAFATDEPIHFGGATLDARGFVPLIGPRLVLATRVTLDGVFGDVPFYELSRAWSYDPNDFPAGHRAIRGVPVGRFAGRAKLMGSIELRSILWRFRAVGHRAGLGLVAFSDLGRVWAGWERDRELDGDGVGLAFGVGLGVRFTWGETVVVRFDAAYSPDAYAASSVPIGAYFALDHAF